MQPATTSLVDFKLATAGASTLTFCKKMREERRSIPEKILGRRKYVRQSDHDFLMSCGFEKDSHNTKVALAVRELIADLALPSSCDRECVLHDYRIESDLGISIFDSLNLVDIVLELEEITGISISDAMAQELAELNRKDSTVSCIVRYLSKIKNPAEQVAT